MASKRAASSTPTLSHATPRAIPGSASSDNHFPPSVRDRQRRASGTPTSMPRRDSESTSIRPTRARVGPLPKNGPGNPLFPPLPPKVPKPRRDSQMSQMERMEERKRIEEEREEESAVIEEDKEPQGWEAYSAKQRKQRGFAAEGDAEKQDEEEEKAAEPGAAQKEELKEEDHETMTSGLSENEAGNESAEEGQPDTTVTQESKTVKAEPEETSDFKDPKVQAEDVESQTSSEKRSLRNRSGAAESNEPKDKKKTGTVDVDMDVTMSEMDVVEADPAEDVAPEDQPEGQVDANGDVTRCPCGREADIDAMMIQCDHCNVWQHGACVGIWGDEEAPDEYFCELCKPNLHAPLRRFLRQRQKQGLGFSVPTPEDLKHFFFASDRHKPSQSKRWTDPSVIKDESASPPPPAAPVSKSSASHHAPASRSHKAKAQSPAVDTRRSAGAGHRAHSGLSDKAGHSDFKVPSGSSTRPNGGAGRRFSNASDSDSPTSVHGSKSHKDLPPGKKRSTMNSRDAAYEEAIAASLREAGGEGEVAGTRSRRGATESRDEEHDEDEGKRGKKSGTSTAGTPGVARGQKRSRQEEEDDGEEFLGASARRQGKKKKDESEANKPKHPNQYTYRKPGPSGSSTATPTQASLNAPEKSRALPNSPSKKQGLSAGAGSNATSRRLGAGTRGGTPSSVSGSVAGGGVNGNTSLTWNLPDHLAPFAYTLPPHPPTMLEIITPRPSGNGKQRANADPQDGESSTSAAALAAPATHLEAPTKVRYPTKRMTIGEMRKRVRNLLEFVGRVQGEEDKRAERARLLGLSAQLMRDEGDNKAAEDVVGDVKGVLESEEAMQVDAPDGDAAQKAETVPESNVEDVATPVPVPSAEASGNAQPMAMDVDAEVVAGEETTAEPVKPEEKPVDSALTAPETTTNAVPAEGTEPTKTIVPDDAAASHPTEETSGGSSTVPPPTQDSPAAVLPQPSKSSQLLADLTSDLIRFQMMFEVGGSVFAAPAGANGDDS